MAFVLNLAFAVACLNHAEFAFDDFGQEVARPTGWFEESRVRSVSDFTKSSMALTSRLLGGG
jgi:hypothetical protein